jgi:hypothetical protein
MVTKFRFVEAKIADALRRTNIGFVSKETIRKNCKRTFPQSEPTAFQKITSISLGRGPVIGAIKPVAEGKPA